MGGATHLPTAPLPEALTSAGFENVATYVHSGSAVLRSDKPSKALIAAIGSEKFDTPGMQYQDITDNETLTGFTT